MVGPAVAALISCSDHGRALPSLLADLDGQSLPPSESVLIKNGGAGEYAQQLLAQLEAAGQQVLRAAADDWPAVVNAAARATAAPYLVLLSSGISGLPHDCLERAVSRLEQAPELAFVSLCALPPSETGASNRDTTLRSPATLAALECVMPIPLMVRREVWLQVGGLDEQAGTLAKRAFFLTLAKLGCEGEMLDQPLVLPSLAELRHHQAVHHPEHESSVAKLLRCHQPALDQHAQEMLAAMDRLLLAGQQRLSQLQRRRAAVQQEMADLARQLTSIGQELPTIGRDRIELGDLRRSSPLSPVWGLERGRPLDRYYIEKFLSKHRHDIQGAVLEVKDAGYTRLLGTDRVRRSEVLDINRCNEQATISGDLTRAEQLPHGCFDCFDCFILTQTLNIIFDVNAALTNALRLLRPGGVLLCTVSALNRISFEDGGLDGDYWRFTEASLRRLFAKLLPLDRFEITGYGNVLACAALLYGLAPEELTSEELDHHDPYFPLLYGIRAMRPETSTG